MGEGKGTGWIRIACPRCGFSKDMSSQRVPAAGTMVTCPRCTCRFPFTAEVLLQNTPVKEKPIRTFAGRAFTFVKYTFAGALLLFILAVIIGVYFNIKEKKAFETSTFIQKLNTAEREGGDVLGLLVSNLQTAEKSEEKLIVRWLKKRRNKGELPFLYLIGLYQAKSGQQEKALKYVTAGSLIYRIDAERCGDSSATQTVLIVESNLGLTAVRDILRENQKLRQKIVLWALSYEDANRNRERPDWICAHGIGNFTQESEVLSETEWLNKRQAIRNQFQEKFAIE